MNNKIPSPAQPMSTGIRGLDDILSGGLHPGRLYVCEGEPGSGKTTMALQFLVEGVKHGDRVLYITLAESEAELRAVAASHGWDMQGILIHEVIGSESELDPSQQYTMFHPGEVELGETMQNILAAVRENKPARIVLDSLSELQLLADSALRYRRQVLALKQFLTNEGVTALFLDDCTGDKADLQVRSIAHGAVLLDNATKDYGAERRRIRVVKYRGVNFRGGYHDYKIVRGGLTVFPRLVASETRVMEKRPQIASGLERLDTLLGGGLEEGTSTLISGPPGTGKSSLATQFINAALGRGHRAAMFLFEESASNLINRSAGLGMDLQAGLKDGRLLLQQIDPAEMSPGEFADSVCKAAQSGAKVIVIDSLNGYLHAMPDERFLTTHLHELLTYLGQRGVVTLLVGVQSGMMGGTMSSSVDASYLADNVLMLRYFEAAGEVKQAISVFKKRGSLHERTIRGFTLSPRGIEVGHVLREFHGILTGVPTLNPATGQADGPSK